MMKFSLLNLLLILPLAAFLQNSTIKTDEKEHDYGSVQNVYKLQSDFILTNAGGRNLYLMRADAPADVKVWTSKKTVLPGDTVAVQVYYTPKSEGKFSFPVKLVTSADAEPFVLKIKGDVQSLKKDDKTACYYFRKPKINNHKFDEPVIVQAKHKPADSLFWKRNPFMNLDTSDHIPGQISFKPNKPKPVAPVTETTQLPQDQYKPNNIIFLIDVSGSMKDTTKLRWLKLSMKKLISNVRDIDRITLVTYRDSVMCLAEGFGAANKQQLIDIVDSLRAKGITRGNRAIHFSLDLAIKHYIEGGNNQIILATDGQFTFKEHDYKKWADKVGDKKVVLSTVAFGKDPKAMGNLKDIARKGDGSFIHIKSRKAAEGAIFDEIALRSKK